MKVNFFKTVLPAMVFVLAIGTAFATHSEGSAVDEIGYIQTENPTQPCDADKLCATTGSTICTSDDSETLYQLQGMECTEPLFERQ